MTFYCFVLSLKICLTLLSNKGWARLSVLDSPSENMWRINPALLESSAACGLRWNLFSYFPVTSLRSSKHVVVHSCLDHVLCFDFLFPECLLWVSSAAIAGLPRCAAVWFPVICPVVSKYLSPTASTRSALGCLLVRRSSRCMVLKGPWLIPVD